ncbi:MAG: flagellar biosynthesis protein FliQ [Defluviitaleaceae bacterium]|nr:flagellar biosynthesis protein FliQ [Defluviitaleaceae bacterium]MCL2835852.1 flagellar biosynthesis protein FliQ [Defluviitaleaceae bacterium]
MDPQIIVDLVAQGVITILMVAAPPLIMGLSVGIIVSIFQTVTSIQEQTLAFVPKIAAVFLSLVIWGNWMIERLQGFMTYAFASIAQMTG